MGKIAARNTLELKNFLFHYWLLSSTALSSVYFPLLGYLLFSTAGWGICGPREHLLWPAPEFSSPNIEYKSCQNEAL